MNRDWVGIGLRPPHYQIFAEDDLQSSSQIPDHIGNSKAEIDYLEIIAENYLEVDSVARERLRVISTHYPIVTHSVSLNLLGSDPIAWDQVARLKSLIQELDAPYASDHLCWTASEGIQHHELLPAPYHPDLIPYIAQRAALIQAELGVPFGIENLSSYLTWRRDEMSEWLFYQQVIQASGCWYMLDINNIYVSSQNHGFDPYSYLASIDWSRVLQVHLAGHSILANGLHHDTHDRSICDQVWNLYRYAWQLGGPFPTLIEWDEDIPPLSTLCDEVRRARKERTLS